MAIVYTLSEACFGEWVSQNSGTEPEGASYAEGYIRYLHSYKGLHSTTIQYSWRQVELPYSVIRSSMSLQR